MIIVSRLLSTSDAPLRVVAQYAGYSSKFAFAKAFKRQFGTSPGSYRRQHDNPPAPGGVMPGEPRDSEGAAG
ncbi:AraC family transcriptional regulator [Micromonospora sp. KC213]|uniref:helix-turn-helix domain-containing protein n=1 Tax=Micromonospora sp. KC213 TaxID=2530378 RepID=UPI001052506C|nr:AraC family transcriptional regulator [Micromonospora sp. KC213]TDC41519.1 AraC family transcriptional regulator [Micromonospora sp. KC213]